MNSLTRLVSLGVVMMLAAPVFAESAPVYDADSLPPFEQQGADQGQGDLPPPPSPSPDAHSTSQESAGFVPMQSDQDESPAGLEPRKVSKQPESSVSASTSTVSTAERLRRLEQQVANLQAPEKNVKMDSLQGQIQALRSEVDQLSHTLQQLQKQQKQAGMTSQRNNDAAPNSNQSNAAANRSDDGAIKKPPVESKTTVKTTAKVKATSEDTEDSHSTEETTQPNVQEEQQIYQTAYSLIKSKKYAEAITSLKGMLKKYPSGQFASNAHYWLGELYGLSGKNDQALIEFSTVVKDYSESPRVAEAQLKVGLIYAAESKWPDAKAALKKVVNHYPGTTSARLASEQLKQIKQVGH